MSHDKPAVDVDEDRRKFVSSCGKFALVTPPALTMLLSTSLNSTAIAFSGGQGSSGGNGNSGGNGRGGRGNNGFGNGGGDGSPNGKEDINR